MLKFKVILFLFLFAFMLSAHTFAHPPKTVKAIYDQEKGELSVLVKHSVSDPSSHYIKKIEVFKNGKKIVEKTFRSQTDKSKQEVKSIKIVAKKGNKLKIIAKCNKFGSGKIELEIK